MTFYHQHVHPEVLRTRLLLRPLRVNLLRLRIRLLRILLITLIGMPVARYSTVSILFRKGRLPHKLVQFAPARVAQQDTDVDTNDEEELADGLD